MKKSLCKSAALVAAFLELAAPVKAETTLVFPQTQDAVKLLPIDISKGAAACVDAYNAGQTTKFENSVGEYVYAKANGVVCLKTFTAFTYTNSTNCTFLPEGFTGQRPPELWPRLKVLYENRISRYALPNMSNKYPSLVTFDVIAMVPIEKDSDGNDQVTFFEFGPNNELVLSMRAKSKITESGQGSVRNFEIEWAAHAPNGNANNPNQLEPEYSQIGDGLNDLRAACRNMRGPTSLPSTRL